MSESFDEWYVGARPRVVTAAAITCGNVHLAEEAADEALLKALTRWNRVSEMASPLAWTIQVAVNRARRIERRTLLEARLLRRGVGERSLPGPARELWSVVNELPDRQRQVIALKYLADLLDEDIARLLGISRSAVSSALTDGRRRLQVLLKTSELENR